MRLRYMIMAIVMSVTTIVPCFGASVNSRLYQFGNDINMNGVLSSTGRGFYVENNVEVKHAKVNLIYTKSELLNGKESTITVLINGIPIHSEKLDGEKQYKKQITIEIPQDLIEQGYNQVSIKAYKTLSDEVCRDDSNTANWIVVHKESSITIESVYEPSDNILSEYPSIYRYRDNGSKRNATILLPDNDTSAVLSASMILSAHFGEYMRDGDFKFDVQRYADFENKQDHIIAISHGRDASPELLGLLTAKEKSHLEDQCIIKITDSIFDNTKKLILIISDNDKLLKNGSKLLSSNALIEHLTNESIIIDEGTDVNDLIVNPEGDQISFRNLGYENIILKGPFSQEAIVEVSTPKNKVVGPQSHITLKMRYAQNLDFERALATVYVNERPIGSKKLSQEKSNNDSMELELPNELAGLNYYQIKIVFNLELLDAECVTRDTDNPWAAVSNESFIAFDYSDNNLLKFKHYPYPFVQDGRFEELTVVIPENISSDHLTALANIMANMGRDLGFNDGKLDVVKASEVTGEYKKDSLLIIGTPHNNHLIKEINDHLNVKFQEDFKAFTSNNKVKFVGEEASQRTAIQLIESPYSQDRGAMVIALNSMNDFGLSAKYLTEPNLIMRLTGDTVIIGRTGVVQDLNYKMQTETPEKKVIQNRKISGEGKLLIVVTVFLLGTIVIALILLVLKYRK